MISYNFVGIKSRYKLKEYFYVIYRIKTGKKKKRKSYLDAENEILLTDFQNFKNYNYRFLIV